MKKRALGLSTSSIMIFFISLAAVLIVWFLIKPELKKSGEKIDIEQRCFSVTVKPLSCSYNLRENSVAIKMQLKNGNAVEMVGVLSLEDRTVKTISVSLTSSLTATKTFSLTELSAIPKSMQATAVILNNNEKALCTTLSYEKIGCVKEV